MYSKKLYIIGCGNVGGFIANSFKEYKLGRYESIEFLDDDEKKLGKEIFGYTVAGTVDSINHTNNFVDVVICIANPKIKRQIVQKIYSPYVQFPSFVSKHAWISENVKIGKGVIIYPGVSINYNTVIQDHSIINMNCAIGHDCTISKYSTLAPGVSLAGCTFLEECVDMGINSATVQGIRIGQNTIIGGMGMVTSDIPSDCTAVGVPARTIKSHVELLV